MLHRLMSPYGHRVLPLTRVEGRTCSQLLGCATSLLQNSPGSWDSCLLHHHTAVLRGHSLCFFLLLVPLPPRSLPRSACFSQVSMKSSDPAKYSKAFLFPLS